MSEAPENTQAVDALAALCDPASPLLRAYATAATAQARARQLWQQNHPDPVSVDEMGEAIVAIIEGRKAPPVGGDMVQAAQRRKREAFYRFLLQPAATLPELAFKLGVIVFRFHFGAVAVALDTADERQEAKAFRQLAGDVFRVVKQ